jgi:hypothetical protein
MLESLVLLLQLRCNEYIVYWNYHYFSQLSHYNVATVKVVMIPGYNILSYLITT